MAGVKIDQKWPMELENLKILKKSVPDPPKSNSDGSNRFLVKKLGRKKKKKGPFMTKPL